MMLLFLDSIFVYRFCQPGVQFEHSILEVLPEYDLSIVFPTKSAVYAQCLRVIGTENFPAQFIMEQITRTVLD